MKNSNSSNDYRQGNNELRHNSICLYDLDVTMETAMDNMQDPTPEAVKYGSNEHNWKKLFIG